MHIFIMFGHFVGMCLRPLGHSLVICLICFGDRWGFRGDWRRFDGTQRLFSRRFRVMDFTIFYNIFVDTGSIQGSSWTISKYL